MKFHVPIAMGLELSQILLDDREEFFVLNAVVPNIAISMNM